MQGFLLKITDKFLQIENNRNINEKYISIGYDQNFEKYISFASGFQTNKIEDIKDVSLKDCIKFGNKEKAEILTKELLKSKDAILMFLI